MFEQVNPSLFAQIAELIQSNPLLVMPVLIGSYILFSLVFLR